MYLKEIKINGFKSFADSTTIKLDNNITCIVGPNGSGKSNIVDAIRFVLGEQSQKSLRGSGMTDIIFNGSKNRNPLNVASVSIVLDNSDHYLNLEYSTVSIKRRIYRTGENEYYINGDRVRLKDIVDLFLDTGLGKNSFSIISQGEIARIVSSTKDDRRLFFEEACSIAKYKSRKDEALSKLDKTSLNLTRVSDIISEINRELVPAKQASVKATKYKELQKELKKLELGYIASEIDRIDLNTRLKEKDKVRLEDKLVNTTSTLAKLNLEDEQLISSELELNNKLKELANSELELTSKIAKLDSRITMLNSNNTKKEEATKKLEELEITKLEHNKELELAKGNSKILDKKLSDIVNNLDKVLANLDIVNNKKVSINNELSNLKESISNSNFKLNNLKHSTRSNSKLNRAVSYVIDNNFNGVVDTVDSLISYDTSLDAAMDVSLGAGKYNIVIDKAYNASDIIDNLKLNNLGRVTFLPIDKIEARYISPYYLNKLNNSNLYLGTLDSYIEVDNKYRDIIEYLLATTILVDNLDGAIVISDLVDRRYRVVTKSGEVINSGGSITGGSLNKNSFKKEIANLEFTIKYKNKTYNELVDEYDKLNNKSNELYNKSLEFEKDKARIEARIEENNIKINSVNSSIKKLDIEISNMDSINKGSIDSLVKDLNEEYLDNINKSELTTANKELIENDLANIKNKRYEIKNNIKDLENDKDKYLDEINKIELELSKATFIKDNMINNLKEDYNMTELDLDNYYLDMDTNLAKDKISQLKMQIKDLGNINTDSIENAKRLEDRYNYLNKEANDLKNAKIELYNIIDKLDNVMKKEFKEGFNKINIEFQKIFKDLFKGGSASLELVSPNDVLNSPIEIKAQPPGKKLTSINLLSDGEKSLTAISLIFAILKVKNSPFCVLDEVEAALDSENVLRFSEYLCDLDSNTQFIIITHKKETMKGADTIYGITMEEDGVSKVLSMKMEK